MNSLRSHILAPGDEQAKFIQERISSVEKHVGDLCFSLGAYTRYAARQRDKTDEVASTVAQFAEAETVNNTLRAGLQGCASCFAAMGDHRDAFVRRLETHVVSCFGPVGSQCKDVREEMKAAFTARDRELGRRKQLDKLKQRNPRNRQKILLAETELARASADVSRTLRSLEEHMDAFEAGKLSATTGALRSLVRAEIALHAREVELLTRAYAELALVDEEQDLEDFRLARGQLDMAFRSAVVTPPPSEPGRSDLRTTLRSSLASLFSASSSSLARPGIKGGSSPNIPSTSASLSPTSPTQRPTLLRRGLRVVDTDLEYVNSLTSEESSTSDEEAEPKLQRSVSQPRLSGAFK